MQPKVSVIIISYNCALYISEAIESCLNQSHDNLEIIIGDDGSSDNSREIIDKYVKEYPQKIKTYVMERPNDNIGIIPSFRVSENIKRGIRDFATGKYICIMSADDYYVDELLFENQVSCLEKNDKYLAVACGHRMVWESGKNVETIPPKNINSLFWSGAYIHISCFLMRKEVFDSKYFLPRLCDDTGLLYSLISSGKCVGRPIIGFAYRQREGSIMHKADKLELALLELLLYQDILQVGALKYSSYCRFAYPLNYVLSHRKHLKDKRYSKYVMAAKKYGYSYIHVAINYGTMNFREKFEVRIFFMLTKIMMKISHVIRRLYYRCERLLNG